MNDKLDHNPYLHNRHSIRLKGYYYSSIGAYFITLCTKNRECLFGEIIVGAGSKPALLSGPKPVLQPGPKPDPVHMELNEYGRIVQDTWDDLTRHIKGIQLDIFCIMPNHVHGIISIVRIDNKNGQVCNPADGQVCNPEDGRVCNPEDGRVWNPPLREAKPCGLQEMVRQFKTFSARRINQHRGTPGVPVWQRNYYEHVIRNDEELNGLREYINNNPMNWETDEEFVTSGFKRHLRSPCFKVH